MRQCSEETAKPLEHPINKDGCHGLRVSFSNEVECTKERPDTMVVDGNAMLQGIQEVRMPASCSVEAQALGNVCRVEHSSRTPEHSFFQMEEHKHRTSTGSDTKPNAKEVRTCLHRSSSTSLSHSSLLRTLQNTHQLRGTERKESSFPREQQLRAASWRCVPWEARGTAACGTRKPETETKNHT